MKLLYVLVIILTIIEAEEISNSITNETDRDMICYSYYSSIHIEKVIKGKKKRIETHPKEKKTKIIKANESLKKHREGVLICYNELMKISSFINNRIQKIDINNNNKAFKIYLAQNDKMDLTKYEGKNYKEILKEFNISSGNCAPHKNGKYCELHHGVDIYFDKNEKVKKLLIYGMHVNTTELFFEKNSIYNLFDNNGHPLGLWVKDSYKKLFQKNPSIETQNLIMWNNLTPHIKKVIMTSRNGHFVVRNGRYKNVWKTMDKAYDYINAIEVIYE